jgi:hypothetical protein
MARLKMLPTLFLLLALPVSLAWAHTLVLGVQDNGDGTVTVEGIYSTQEVAAGAEVRLEDREGNTLWKGKLDEFGECTFEKPEGPYTIILDGGAGHTAERKGP